MQIPSCLESFISHTSCTHPLKPTNLQKYITPLVPILECYTFLGDVPFKFSRGFS